MKAAYISFDQPSPNTGSGQVIIHETNALRQVCPDLTVITRQDIKGADKYDFNPFFYDYFAARLVPRDIDFLDMHCSPGLAILDAARPKRYVVSIIAHDLAVSIEEHDRLFGKGTYGLKHNTDPYLHEILLKHAETATCIITPSTHSEKWVRANINNQHVAVIPHGTEIPAQVQQMPPILTFGYLGAFGGDKGLAYLLMAWKYFMANHDPRYQSRLVFGGSHCDYIKQLASQIDPQLGGQTYLGWVNNINDFYNQISVYIQPSATEAFGIETIEAMAYGRPVICSAGAGSADAVSDGVDGFIVPARDPKAILDKLIFFRDNEQQKYDMGARAREKAKLFSWEEVERKYVQFYKEILK